MMYPTEILKPNEDCRIVREVIFKSLDQFEDHFSSMNSVLRVYSSLLFHNFDLERVRDEFCYAKGNNVRTKLTRPTIESIDWANVPEDVFATCIDDNFELNVSDALLVHMNLDPSRYYSSGEELILPKRTRRSKIEFLEEARKYTREFVYTNSGKLVGVRYLEWDEKTKQHRRVVIGTRNNVTITRDLLEYSFHMLSDRHSRNPLGIRVDLYVKALRDMRDRYREFNKKFLEERFTDLILSVGLDEASRMRKEELYKYITTKGGIFDEDTTVLWRNGFVPD